MSETKKMRIGLNAGHTLTGYGSGAIGVLNESQETRKVVAALTPMFEAAGCEIVPCTVDKASSQNAYLAEVVNMANREDLDWFISVHFNSNAAKNGQGVEIYTYKGRQYPDAVEVCEHIAALGFKNRGVKEGTGLYVVRKTKAKSMLIEVCFVNEPDAATYKKVFEEICKAIVYAMADYVGAAPVPETPAVLPEKKAYVKVLFDGLSIRKSCSWAGSAVCGTVKKNEVFTVVDKQIPTGSKVALYRLKSGVWITSSEKYVKYYEK